MTAAQLRMKTKLVVHDAKKKGQLYYVHFEWYDEDGKIHKTNKSTGYSVNKPKTDFRDKSYYLAEVEDCRRRMEAEKISELLSAAEARKNPEKNAEHIFFCDWVERWYQDAKNDVPGTGKDNKPYAESTLYTYGSVVNQIVPYFKEHHYMLSEIDSDILRTFYDESITDERTPKTVKHYQACISRSLEYAKELKLIKMNPARGSFRHDIRTGFTAEIFNEEELCRFVSLIRGTWLEVPVWFASTYGLRRSEVVGIRWSMIDFKSGILKIHGKYIDVDRNGRNPHYETKLKNSSSRRTIPLNDDEIVYLKRLKAEQEERQKNPGYNMEYTDYACVTENGDLIRPNYLTQKVPEFCSKHNLPTVTFHGLRHTTVSLLLLNGVPLEQVSKLVGHSQISTTANIYHHMPDQSKKKLTSMMGTIIATGRPIA